MTKEEEHIRAVLANDFWITDHTIVPGILGMFTTNNGRLTNRIKQLQQFTVNKTVPFLPSLTSFNHKYTLVIITVWKDNHHLLTNPAFMPSSTQYALTKEHANETELWFGVDSMRTVKDLPSNLQIVIDGIKDD